MAFLGGGVGWGGDTSKDGKTKWNRVEVGEGELNTTLPLSTCCDEGIYPEHPSEKDFS